MQSSGNGTETTEQLLFALPMRLVLDVQAYPRDTGRKRALRLGCTERTILRTFSELTARGILRRRHEGRESRYRVVETTPIMRTTIGRVVQVLAPQEKAAKS